MHIHRTHVLEHLTTHKCLQTSLCLYLYQGQIQEFSRGAICWKSTSNVKWSPCQSPPNDQFSSFPLLSPLAIVLVVCLNHKWVMSRFLFFYFFFQNGQKYFTLYVQSILFFFPVFVVCDLVTFVVNICLFSAFQIT